jgi:hypothetical protein
MRITRDLANLDVEPLLARQSLLMHVGGSRDLHGDREGILIHQPSAPALDRALRDRVRPQDERGRRDRSTHQLPPSGMARIGRTLWDWSEEIPIFDPGRESLSS